MAGINQMKLTPNNNQLFHAQGLPNNTQLGSHPFPQTNTQANQYVFPQQYIMQAPIYYYPYSQPIVNNNNNFTNNSPNLQLLPQNSFPF